MMNTGGRLGGAITAALFLKEFTGGLPWIHLDIAGTAWAEENKPFMPKGPTGVGSADAGGTGLYVAHLERLWRPLTRRPRTCGAGATRGKNPRAFHDKYKELNPERYAADVREGARIRPDAGRHARSDHGARGPGLPSAACR